MGEKRPIGIILLPSLSGFDRNFTYRLFIIIFTFLCYTSYHLSRKPVSIVKSVLHRNCAIPLDGGEVYPKNSTACDWNPFNHDDSSALLGGLDLAYLFSYAIGMFCSGHIAERMNLRHFLSIGMISSGIMTAAFGMGYFFSIHKYWFYIVVMIVGGFVQSSGWPSVVTCMGNWYGKGKRGFIMGVWNSHTSVGNILGSLIAGFFVNTAWGWSFVVPGIIITVFGILVAFFLVPNPSDVGCSEPEHYGPEEAKADIGPLQHISDDFDSSNDIDKAEKAGDTNKAGFTGTTNPSVVYVVANGSDCSPAARVKFENESRTISNGAQWKSKSEPVVVLSVKKLNRDSTPEGLSNLKPATTAYGNAQTKKEDAVTDTPLLRKKDEEQRAISFWKAVRIPGVLEFSLCLFFAKLVSYTFLFWLPNYIHHKRSDYDAEVSGDLSTLFDVGGILGGITAGVVSDFTGARATTCTVMLAMAAPLMYVYNVYGSIDMAHNVGLLLVCGFMVNGPYALITTAVSADLGTHKSLHGNAKALATVTAIIDGTGSIGAAIGPLLTGVISPSGWQNVFYMLMGADVLAMMFLGRLVFKEVQASSFFSWGRTDTEISVSAKAK